MDDGIYAFGASVRLTDVSLVDSKWSGVAAYSDDVSLNGVDVEEVITRFPAVRVQSNSLDLGPLGDIQNVTGANNGWDAIGIGGSRVVGSFVWSSVQQHSVPLPLGYAVDSPTTVQGPGTIVIPVGGHAVINSRLTLLNTAFDASSGGATIDAGPNYVSNGSGYEEEAILLPFEDGDNLLSSVTLTGASVEHVVFDLQNQGTRIVGVAAQGFVSTNSTFSDSFINVDETPARITGGSFTDGRVSGEDSPLTVVGVHMTATPYGTPGSLADRATAISSGPTHKAINIQNNVIEHYALGISVGPPAGAAPAQIGPMSDDVVVRGNDVRDTGKDFGPYAGWLASAIWLQNVQVSVGQLGDVGNNIGANNEYDQVQLTGDITSDFTWVTPTNAPIEHPLGYVTSGIRMSGPTTLTLPPKAVVKVLPKRNLYTYAPYDNDYGIELDGASLVAGPGSVVTHANDLSVGLSWCYWQPSSNSCPGVPPEPFSYIYEKDMWFAGINIHADPSGVFRGTADISGLTLKYGALRIDSGASSTNGQPYGAVVHGLTLLGGEVIADHTAVLLDGLDLDQSLPPIDQSSGATPYKAGVTLRGSTGSIIEGSRFKNMEAGLGIKLDDADAVITKSTFAFFVTAVLATSGGGQLAVDATQGKADISCISYGPYTWGLALNGNSSVHDSNLLGGHAHPKDNTYITTGYDVDAETPTVDATGNWWGQAQGPTSGQLAHPQNTNTGAPRSVPSSCAPPLIGNPGQPVNLTAIGGSPHLTKPGMIVSWQRPIDNGATVTGYELTVSGSTSTDVIPASATTWTVPGVAPGDYTVTLAARSSQGLGFASSTQVRVIGQPSAPRSLHVSVSGTVGTLTWAPPVNNGGAPILGYAVTFNGKTTTYSAASRKAYLKGLVRGHRYVVTVRARNVNGYGATAPTTFAAGMSR
jgi:hypothetical protein